jgi:hypothetical protein
MCCVYCVLLFWGWKKSNYTHRSPCAERIKPPLEAAFGLSLLELSQTDELDKEGNYLCTCCVTPPRHRDIHGQFLRGRPAVKAYVLP